MGRLQDRVAIITGASAGIGRATARRFAEEGASVGLIDIDDAGAASLVEEVRADGGIAAFMHADVADASELEGAIDTLADELGGIDVLDNNAGGATRLDDHVTAVPLDEFDRAIGLNLRGPFLACRYAIPHLTRRGGGSIINTASIRSSVGTVGADAYTAAKGGIVALTRALAVQCAPAHIRVNAIAPGAVLTERVRRLIEAGSDSGPDPRLVEKHLLGLGQPDDVAGVALFFASDDSRWITGQVLPVDGGASIW